MKGKVLFLSQCYPNQVNPVGGIFVRRQAQALRELGWEIKVISPLPWLPVNINKLTGGRWSDYNLVPRREAQDGIETIYTRYLWLPRLHHPYYWNNLWAGPVRRSVLELYRHFKFDLIHSHMLYPEGWLGARLSRELGVGHVVTSHGDDALPQPMAGYARLITQAVQGSGQVVAVSLSQSRRIQNLLSEERPFPVVYNGFDEDLFFPAAIERQWALDIFGRKEPAVMGLYVGALQPAKGVFELEQAFRRLHSENPGFILTLVGDGASRPQLERNMSDLVVEGAVHFAGKVDGKSVARWMNASDFLILPSYTEGFPCVISEAMACARPIVATSVGGIGELVLNGHNGLLASPRDVESLVQALKQMAGLEASERAIWGSRSRALIADKSWRANAITMDQIYLNVLRKGVQ